MYKLIITIFFLFVFVIGASAAPIVRDTVPSGVPQLFGGKYYKFNGYILADSFIMNAPGDTNNIPYFPSIKFKSSDNRWYAYDRTRWQKLIFANDSLSSLSNVTITNPKNAQILVYDSVTSKWKNRSQIYFNVKDYGATGDSTTDDRLAIIKARDAAYAAGGGVLFFPAGKYRMSDSVLLNRSIRIQGVTKSGGLHNNQGPDEKDRLGPIEYSSVVYVTDGKSGFVFERQPTTEIKGTIHIENISFASTVAPGSATGGAFITIRGMIQDATITTCTFYGGYLQINIESSYYQNIYNCHFSAPLVASIKTGNNIRTDTGDFTVLGCIFNSGTFNTNAAQTKAIWWYSGGGMRIIDNKFDAAEFDTSHAFRYHIFAENTLDPTSDFIVADNSFENYTISAIYMHGIMSPYVRHIQITNNQIAPVGSSGAAIDIDQMEDVLVSEFSIRDWATNNSNPAIKITNTAHVNIGAGIIHGYASDYSTTGSTDVFVDYSLGSDVAIGSRNTSNIAGLNTSLYTTATILGRSTSGTSGSGILELASQLPDAAGAEVGFIDFTASTNSPGHKRVGVMGALTDGSSSGAKGGKLVFLTKPDANTTPLTRMEIDNTGSLRLNTYGIGTHGAGIPTYNLAVDALGDVIEIQSGRWLVSGNDIYYTAGNVGIGKSSGFNSKLDIESSVNSSDGVIIKNSSSGTSAETIYRLENNAGEVGKFSLYGSNHPTLPNYLFMAATKNVQIGSDQGVASGGTSAISFVTGGFSASPAMQIKGNGNALIGTTTDGGEKFQVNGSVALDLGSDATGDIFYRNSGGAFTRLGIGSSSQVLTVSGGLPSWQTPASMPTMASGRWLPTISAETNATSITADSSQYIRQGDIVSFTVRVTLTITTGATLTGFDFSLPIASNLAVDEDLIATLTTSAGSAGYAYADATNETGEVNFTPASNGAVSVVITGHYKITPP